MFRATQIRNRPGRITRSLVFGIASAFAMQAQATDEIALAPIRATAGEAQSISWVNGRKPFTSISLVQSIPEMRFPPRIVRETLDGGPALRITLAPSTPSGIYTIRVSGLDLDNQKVSASFRLTVAAVTLPNPANGQTPVILINGFQLEGCAGQSSTLTESENTFGPLWSDLEAGGTPVSFFNYCFYAPDSLIETIGSELGTFISQLTYANGTPVTQVDLVTHSMGGLIARSYLAGLQPNGTLAPPANPGVRKLIEIATPNYGSFIANYSSLLTLLGLTGVQAAEMIPGSSFLWNLNRWNQGGDDLRGVDALAIIGNLASCCTVLLPPPSWTNASDGVVSITSASLGFAAASYARNPVRTRIVPYCHTSSLPTCSGPPIAHVDQAPETGEIVQSFLSNTSSWESIGETNQTQYGGVYFALENAAGTQYDSLSSVSLGSQSLTGGATNTIFYDEFATGSGTFQAETTSSQSASCGTFSVGGGYYTAFRCKYGPVISSISPTLSGSALVVQAGGNITISGVGFGQTKCSGCSVTAYPGPVSLTVTSWSDQVISASLPSTFNGIAEVVVQASAGSDSMTFMAAPPAVVAPPTISLSATQLQFAYTIGGAIPPAQAVTVSNSGGGSLVWSASANANWILCSSTSNGVSVLISPANLAAGTYTGTISITVAGASNSPQTISVTLTVSGAAPSSPTISLSTTYLQFAYTIGGAVPAAQTVNVSNSGSGTLSWSASTNSSWILYSSVSGGISVQMSPANLAGGTYAGTITITASGASNSPQTIFVNLLVSTPGGSTPSPIITAVTNSCDGSSVIAPNTWIAIHGLNLAPSGDTRIWTAADFANNQLPTALDGVSITMNGEKAYVYYISATQINVLTPPDLATGSVQLTVTNGAASSSVFTAQSMQLSPALFVFNTQGYVVAQHVSTFTDIGPSTLYPGLTTPANPGEQIVVYGNGFGATTVPVTGGSQTQTGPLTGTVQVQVGGSNAKVQYAGLASPGLYQFNITLPASLPAGNVPISIVYNGQSTQSGVVLSIQ